jgi:hypothetical protein
MKGEHSGTVGWGLLAAGVAVWDLTAPESLTAAFKRGTANEKSRPYVVGALGVTALHLMGAIPRAIDPFYMVLDRTPLRNLDVDKGPTVSD